MTLKYIRALGADSSETEKQRERKMMTRVIQGAGDVVWPSVVEAQARKSGDGAIVFWTVHFEVAHG